MTDLLLRGGRTRVSTICLALALLGGVQARAQEAETPDVAVAPANPQPVPATLTTEQLSALVDARVAEALKAAGSVTNAASPAALTPSSVEAAARSGAVPGAGVHRLIWIQYLLVFSPILLHILVLFWIRSSKMSLKEALGDKEELNKEANRVQVSLAQAANRNHALRSQALNTVLAQPLAHLIAQPAGVPPAGPAGAAAGPMAQPAAAPAILQAAATADIEVRQQIVNYIFDSSRGQMPPPVGIRARPAQVVAEGLADAAADANPPVAPGDNSPPLITSVSRLIVFVSGYAGISISTALASFMIYKGMVEPGKELPDLNGLLLLMLSLGIGVVPYAVNRITASARATSATGG